MSRFYHYPSPEEAAAMEASSALEDKIFVCIMVFMLAVLALTNMFVFYHLCIASPRKINVDSDLELQALDRKVEIKWWLHDYDSE
ncbi:uncharacterized protein F4807DRAFT_27405 [Annulohypoxylon truncatum]|uniref:uncharacterized protein n=1 Tax=Annulohypoxylon truncatum TaxID=327061 RepID=UPI0020076191|nr:uncharacterized protein F4807DRAFT_27405 [Annulohypoxylon truncatum]KAI1211164.1 hypothetical protein F4807DRAFT_27405 [Annulohypoxylon truncatum]